MAYRDHMEALTESLRQRDERISELEEMLRVAKSGSDTKPATLVHCKSCGNEYEDSCYLDRGHPCSTPEKQPCECMFYMRSRSCKDCRHRDSRYVCINPKSAYPLRSVLPTNWCSKFECTTQNDRNGESR